MTCFGYGSKCEIKYLCAYVKIVVFGLVFNIFWHVQNNLDRSKRALDLKMDWLPSSWPKGDEQ